METWAHVKVYKTVYSPSPQQALLEDGPNLAAGT